jgi:membrane-bound lytic murein transglycosylase A
VKALAAAAAFALAASVVGAGARERTDEMSPTNAPKTPSPSAGSPSPRRLEARKLAFSDLPGWEQDDALAAFDAFARSCRATLSADPALRPGSPPTPGLLEACRAALARQPKDADGARAFFQTRFEPWEIASAQGTPAFYTGYYEPEVEAALAPERGFSAALRARPADLETWPPDAPPPGAPEGLAAALRGPEGSLSPVPTRAEIDAGALDGRSAPIAYVRDPVEAFMIHVQGSARLRLNDGRVLRAVYDGRNGRPYVSIGKVLADERGMAPQELTLGKLKAWVRAAGQSPGEEGLALLHRNASFIFFRLDEAAPADAGPIGAQGLRLTPLRSIAVDRSLWPYGLPVWIDADLPWRSESPTSFRRLTIAQDTGSAILGPARADLFYGSGEAAGARAGATRHRGRFVALLPQGETPIEEPGR